MAYIDTFTAGSASADKYSTLLELLVQLPDNTSNLIVARDIRDSIYTLWSRIDDVQSLAATAASASAFFTNLNPSSVAVGGLTAGLTFSNVDMQTMWNSLLYPYVSPGLTISIASNQIREFGSPTVVNLNWSVEKKSDNIISPILAGTSPPIVAIGGSQSGTAVFLATHSNVPISPISYQYISLTASDGVTTKSTNVELTWKTRIYWGKVDFSSIGNPNLTLNPGSFSICSGLITYSTIENLTGASANGQAFGSELSEKKEKNFSNIHADGQYLIFAWPSIVSNSYLPTFEVNGMINTAFTRLKTNWPFLRSLYGYSGVNYEVWVSNTRLFSPVSVVIT